MSKEGKNFEKTLPDGFEKAFTLDAKSTKAGLILNLIALLVLGICAAIGFYLTLLKPVADKELDPIEMLIALCIFLLIIIVYTVLHELVHGAAYKALTDEKLTFGLSWSCAFCGVPNIYTYRRTALIACSAPMIFFTVLTLPILAALYFVNSVYFMLGTAFFGLHLGGCSGDFYVCWLLLFHFKDKNTLMNDTGPVMTLYVPTK